jgi:hypothetical protein
MPCDWRPNQVIDPRSGQPFTDPGAWEFIVEKLSDNEPLETISLLKPPGKVGYVMKIRDFDRNSTIYIKLQLGAGVVIGRSFHYSDFD